MTIQIALPPQTEAKLREHAAVSGKELTSYVLEALEEKLGLQDAGPADNGHSPQELEEWLAEFRQWVSSHPPLPDEADDSRESIYAGRGE